MKMITFINRHTFSNTWRISVASVAFIAASVSVPVLAQVTTAPVAQPEKKPTAQAAKDAEKDSPLILAKFEVTSTQDRGYVSTNSQTAFKTKEALLMIPQPVLVVTRDMIEDLGYNQQLSDTLQYVGVANVQRGESVGIRGARITNGLTDGMGQGQARMDQINIDSYEIIKGPSRVLYSGAATSGAIIKNTRRPLPYKQDTLTVGINQYGLYRTEIDSGGPSAKVGDGEFSHRFVAAHQSGGSYYDYVDKTLAIHPSLQFKYKNTTVLAAVDYQRIVGRQNGNNFLTPEGNLFTGAGRKETYYTKGAETIEYRQTYYRMQLQQQFSPTWELNIKSMYAINYVLNASRAVIYNVNYINRTATMLYNKPGGLDKRMFLQADVVGRYEPFGIKMQNTFGVQLDEGHNSDRGQEDPNHNTFNTQIFSIDKPFPKYAVPIYITPSPFLALNGRDPDIRSQNANFYFQESAEFFDRLTLVYAKSYSASQLYQWDPLPKKVVGQSKSGAFFDRYGIVLKLTKDIVLYALDSTTGAPPAPVLTADGSFIKASQTRGKEIGLKTALFGGRLSSTFSFFDLSLTNQKFQTSITSDGKPIFALSARTIQKGFDMDIAATILPNWQLIATYYNGKVRDALGKQVPLSYTGTWSVLTRYDFESGILKGWKIGLGAARIDGRAVKTGDMVFPVGVPKSEFFPNVQTATPVNLFASRNFNKHWSVRLSCQNLFDAVYPGGVPNYFVVDPADPRTIAISTRYRF